MDPEAVTDWTTHSVYPRRFLKRRYLDWGFLMRKDDAMTQYQQRLRHNLFALGLNTRIPDSNITSTTDAERLQVLDAVGRAKDLKLCLRRIWAVASSLPGRENSLPELIPVPGTFSIPGHDRERHEHEQCTFDFCEQSRVDFTSVAQHHEMPCRGNCEQTTFPLILLNERVGKGEPTAWTLDEPSLLDASHPYMAISHVWSDGTGSGIWGPGKVNKCLYTLFSNIARSFQCEGCWWDTISIPLDDKLRTKALSSMHTNYNNSRITLVHDLYLREWEWIDSETACFAIVMSPWYSRGWTALELAQSHKVKILFKAKNNNYVIKDLDVDILAEVPENHATANAIRKLRHASINEFGTLLAILGARDTSKPRDVPIISGLLAGVDVSGGLSQQEIYQRILRKLGRVAQGHLFHNSATMSAPGFSWCPTNVLDMPLADKDSAMLKLHENGDLEGHWAVQKIDSVGVEDLITRGTHPLTQVSLESAFCGKNKKKHVLLLETNKPKATGHDRRALLVRLMESSAEILAKFVGPVHFRARPASGEQQDVKPPHIKVRIGSTDGLNDVPGEAWEWVQNKIGEKTSTTGETPVSVGGQPNPKSDTPPNNDGVFGRAFQDMRAIFFTEAEGVLDNSLLVETSRIRPISKNLESEGEDQMRMFFHRDNNPKLEKPPRAFFYGHKRMVSSVKDWLGNNPDLARGQVTVLALGNDNKIVTGLKPEEQEAAKQLLGGEALLLVAESNGRADEMTALVTLLLDIKAPHKPNASGQTPLHIALHYHKYGIAETLLRNETSPAPVDAQDDPLQRTALHYAAMSGNVGVVKILLERRASRHILDCNSQVPLHCAANNGFDEIVQLLLNDAERPPSDSNSRDTMETCNAHSKDTDRVARSDTNGVTGHGPRVQASVETDVTGTVIKILKQSRTQAFHVRKDSQGQTPLHLAAKAGHNLVVTTLLTHGADPCAETSNEETALMLAAEGGYLQVVQKLLTFKNGGFPSSELDRALLMAAVRRNETVITELHKNGARSNITYDFEGKTALHWTIKTGNGDGAELLISSLEVTDVDFLEKTHQKKSALLMASEMRMTSVVTLLLKRGADIKLADSNKRTALHLAAMQSDKDTVRELLDQRHHCHVNASDYKKRTALHYAALHESTDVTDLIVKSARCHHNIEDEDGCTALEIASERGLKDVVKTLLEGGSDPKHGKDGRTALERAAAVGHSEVVQVILPSIEASDIKERAMQLAAKSGHLSVAMLLHESIENADKKASALRTIFIAAAASIGDNAMKLNELWTHCTDPNIQDDEGRSLLMLAIKNQHKSLAKYLFSLRLKIDLKDNKGKTALMVAAIKNDASMVVSLLDHGANPDLRDNKGYTALHYAVEEGCYHSVTELLRLPSGSLKTIQDCQKRTPLHIALEKIDQWNSPMPGMSRVSRLWTTNDLPLICIELITHGIQLHCQDENGRNALHLTVAQDMEPMAHLLLLSRRSEPYQRMDTEDSEGQTPLLLAAAKGYTSLVVLMLDLKFKPDTKDKNGQTPLLLTSERGDEKSVEALLTHGADPNLQDKHGRTALSQAARNGHGNVLKTLLRDRENRKTSLNTRDNMGRTALILAAENGHASIVKTLIDNSANADVVGYDGKKAWQKAVDKGHTLVVERLLSNKGAPIQDRQAVNEALLLASRRGWAELVEVLLLQEVDLTFQSSGDKWTALHMAAMSGHQRVLKMLLKKGVDIVIKDRNGRTALFQATEQGFESIVGLLLEREEIKNDTDAWMGQESLLFAAEKGYDGIVKLLLDSGVNCNATDASERTVMSLAAGNGQEAIVKMLMKKGASWAIKDKNERTALHHAAWGGYHNIVKNLLAYEPTVVDDSRVIDSKLAIEALTTINSSVVDNGGQSALHLAAERASIRAVEGLLDKRANVSAKCKDGQTALHRAAWGGSCDVVSLLRRNGADPFIRDNQDKKPWHIAAEKGHETIAVELLQEEESLYDERILGQKALIFAAKMGYTRIARCLLLKHVEATVKDEDGRTPLHWAASRGDIELAKRLIDHGDVSVDAVDHKRRTALSLAALDDRTTAVEFLLEEGLDADIPDAQGQTALHHAAMRGNEEISQILIDHDADPHIHDNNRKKAWQLAAENGHHQVVRLLLKKEFDISVHNQRREQLFLEMSERDLVPMVQLLLDLKVDKNVQDRFGQTAISLAARHDADDVFRLLLSKGADPSIADNHRQTPLLWAAKTGNVKVISLLLDKITSDPSFIEGENTVNHQDAKGRTALVIAIKNKHNKAVKLLLEKCRKFIKVNIQDNKQRTALQLAAEMGNNTWVQLLLHSKAEQQHTDSLGRTALLLAVEQGHTEVVKALINSTSEYVDVADKQDRTPLQAATDLGNQEVVAALLEARANPDALDERLRTALLLAVEHGDKVIVDLLLKKNAASSRVDKDGRTPLLLAIANGNKDIVEALLNNSSADSNLPDAQYMHGKSLLHLAVESGNKDVAWLVAKMVTSRTASKDTLYAALP